MGACSASRAMSRTAKETKGASWYSKIVDEGHDVVLVMSPRSLMRDRVYGPLLKQASDLAAIKGPIGHIGSTALSAFERSEDVVLAIRDDDARDAVIIVTGVPGDLDPEALVDGE